ncbi:phage baseplate protein [Pseudomonas sp. p1(2021b)]|uniref:phage baseplate protein n=1 Tax=Pseudomonas sp. p1(2021b) TaxID=2874628 RepID=UPI003D2A4735
MQYVIIRSTGDVLYFDAITALKEISSSSVTSQPVASGSRVTDHVIRDNFRLSISAVLSDADFNLQRPVLDTTGNVKSVASGAGEFGNSPTYSRGVAKQFENNTPVASTVTISERGSGGFAKYLPETLSQYTGSDIPTVIVHQQSKVRTATAVRDTLQLMADTSERFSFAEVNNNIITRAWPDCVFTSLVFAQDADTGEGVFPEMEIEKVQVVDTQKVQVALRGNSKGKQSPVSVNKRTTKKGDDPEKGPTDFSNGKSPYEYRNEV